jgi:hypothetical protein
MVFTSHVRFQDGATRRELLRTLAAVGAAGVLAGCDLLKTPPPEPDPLLDFLAETRALASLYAAAVATAQPDLANLLAPIRDAHTAHATALTQMINPPSGTPTPPPSGAASATPATKEALLAVEKTAAKKAYDTCLTVPASRATLLGEIAAARATHAAVLS